MNGVVRPMVIMVVVVICFIAMHELAHYVKFEEYGCKPRITTYKNSPATTAICPVMSESKEQGLDVSQSIVEAIGYQLFVPLILFTFYIFRDS